MTKAKIFFQVVLSYLDIVKVIALFIGVIDGVIWLTWGFCFFLYSGLLLVGKEKFSGDLLPNWASMNWNHPVLMFIGIACMIYSILFFIKMEEGDKKIYKKYPLKKQNLPEIE